MAFFPGFFQALDTHAIADEVHKPAAAWFQRDNILDRAWRWTKEARVRKGFVQPKLKLESAGNSIDLWTPDPQ